MTRNETPRTPESWRNRANWTIAGLVVVVIGTWHLAAVMTTPGLDINQLGTTLGAVVHGGPINGLPGGGPSSPGVLIALWVAMMLMPWIIIIAWAWLPRRGSRASKTEGLSDVREMTKTLASGHGEGGRQLTAIARYKGKEIRPRAEDTGAIIAPPRKGKTAFFAVGKIIDAVGKVVATSTKLDLVRLTAGLRRKLGRVYIFDPSRVGIWHRSCHWDMVAGCEDGEEAIARAEAAVAAVSLGSGGNSEFFAGTSATILQCLLHAAALEGLTMREVMGWSRDLHDPEPLRILEENPRAEEGWEDDLRAVALGKSDTIESTRMTLSLTLKPLRTKRVLDRVCPSPSAVMFDPAQFVNEDHRDTLYLLSSGGKSSCAPLTTALAASVDRLGRVRSQRRKSSRLEIPIEFVLDEVANTAPLPDLPQMMSDGGGRGMPVWVIAQAYSQLRSRWGDEGASTIWDSAGIKILLGGSSDDSFLERISRLIGTRKVNHSTVQASATGVDTGTSTSLHTERIMEISDLHEIASGKAYMQFDSIKGAIVDLIKWWDRPDAAEIRASVEYVWTDLEEHATDTQSTAQLFEELKHSAGIGESEEQAA